MTIKQSTIAISALSLREVSAFSKRKLNKKIKLITWIKKQEMKRVQKMSAAKIIVLTRELNIDDTLTARKKIVKIKKFKKLIIFRVIFEENKKISKLNDFWIINVVLITILRREKSKMIIYKIKIKNIFQNIKNEKAKIMQKVSKIMHSKLQIRNVKWLARNSEKKSMH